MHLSNRQIYQFVCITQVRRLVAGSRVAKNDFLFKCHAFSFSFAFPYFLVFTFNKDKIFRNVQRLFAYSFVFLFVFVHRKSKKVFISIQFEDSFARI